MGLFGKSFEEKVQSAVEKVRGQFPGASIHAQVANENVTLTGRAPDLQTKTAIMAAFNSAVETKNTINQIAVEQPQSQPAGAGFGSGTARPATTHAPANAPIGMTAASEHRMHDVVSGDTLSALAKRYYGDASKYHRIFEANRDQLNDPDKIKVGQRLKIPT
jgi:nucleoid-associated protein YgaU